MDRPVEQNRSGGYTPLQYSPSGFLMQLNAPSGQSSFVPVPAGGMAIWANNTIYYRHPEWLGSSRLTSDQNHNIYSDSAYSPFGEVYAQAGLSDESFTGMDQSTVTNMYDFPARELAIVQSNWLSPDPAGLASVDPSDPQTWNRYAYVRNSPLTETDPTGMGGFVNGQPACIWNSCQTGQIEDQAELNYQNEESIYGYGGYNEFDTLSFALAPTCQNDCRVFYGNLDALGLLGLPGMSALENPQNLLPPPNPNPCANRTLSAVGVTAQEQISMAQTLISAGKSAGNAGPYGNPILAFFGGMFGYYEAVHTNGPNDIKDQPGYSPQNQDDVDAGNISFGITCIYGAGFCRLAAGIAQTMKGSPDFDGTLATGFDTPSDDQGIRIGQAMRAAGCHE